MACRPTKMPVSYVLGSCATSHRHPVKDRKTAPTSPRVSHQHVNAASRRQTGRHAGSMCVTMVPATADSGDGNYRSDHIVVRVTLQAGKKDSNKRFVTSHNNYVITAIPTGVRILVPYSCSILQEMHRILRAFHSLTLPLLTVLLPESRPTISST